MTNFGFESLEIYQLANEIGKSIWDICSTWNRFDKETLGKQIVRSADSVSLNICEGYGRFFYNDKKLFFYYSRGSLYETFEALNKAKERNLISDQEHKNISIKITRLAVKLNNYIKTIKPPIEGDKMNF